MKTKILAGLLALTVVTGVEQGAALAAETSENREVTVSRIDVEDTIDAAEATNTAIAQEAEKDDKQPVASKESAKDKSKENKAKKKAPLKTKQTKKAPLTIEGDELFFDDASGEVHATGNVVVTQTPDTMLTKELRGNTKATEVWIDGEATMIQPEMATKMVGHTVHYNYATKLGTMADAKGMVGNERVAGKNMQFFPDKLISHEATMTRCPAKVPDYHISATKVEIWPGDKLIAYNAKVWIKNTVIYSVGVYQRSLRKEEGNEMPQINYSTSDGLSVQQYYEYPLTNNWALATNQAYYTKQGYRPQYSLIDREDKYRFRIQEGHFRDDSSNWVKKEPEFRFDWYQQRIGQTVWSYKFTAIYGKWRDNAKTSWHQDYALYFTRDPIKLSDSLTWYIGTGYEIVRESYNGSRVNTMTFNTSFYKTVSPKLTVWTGYNYTQNTKNLFDYDKNDVGREWVNGITYTLDRMNTISYSKSYDLQYKRTHADTFTWVRNLHCWTLTLNYVKYKDHSNSNSFNWNLSLARW
ncbi:LPS-assembly protein LptD [Azotosporobacter soli]|uniref:LPS-assembly protein LptD n=1 Tax=Azotosporobacter soli TaxID=3055040 RepID=UPI0031FE548A